jgi:hypothetical protein
MKYGA